MAVLEADRPPSPARPPPAAPPPQSTADPTPARTAAAPGSTHPVALGSLDQGANGRHVIRMSGKGELKRPSGDFVHHALAAARQHGTSALLVSTRHPLR